MTGVQTCALPIWGVAHGNDVGGLDDLNSEAAPVWMRQEFPLEDRRAAHKRDLHVKMPRGSHRAVDNRRRRVVAPHRVNGDADHDECTMHRAP